MMHRQLISFASKSTDFRMGYHALGSLPKLFSNVVATPKRAILVVDESYMDRQGVEALRALIDAGFTVSDLALPAHEHIATMEMALRVYEALSSGGITHDDLVVGLGPSELCALVAYCARTWCDETPYALLPTTLDAMVSVATKMVPLDLGSSRAMVSVPAHAALVVCDFSLLGEADDDSFHLGLVEMLISSLIDGRKSWDRFSELIPLLLDLDEAALAEALGMSQTARAFVVNSNNPSTRNSLEYGVTTARALRSALGEDDIPWYRLLAAGISFEGRMAHDACGFSVDDVFEQDDRLQDMGIPELGFDLSDEAFLRALRRTRLSRSNRFMFSLPRHPGTIRCTNVEDEVLERHVRAFLSSRAELLDSDADV